MRIFCTLLCIFSLLVLEGCAAGRSIDYSGSSNFTAPSANSAIALGAQDERPYVVNREKEPTYVGKTRSLYGIPFNTTTSSGQPLADEIGSLVATTIRKNGSTVKEIKLPIGASAETRVALFKPADAMRSYFFEIREWRTDRYMRVSLTYDISLSVLDKTGAVLATKSTKGDDIKLGGHPDFADLATAVSTIFGGLVNDAEIVSASKTTSALDKAAAVPSASTTPTAAISNHCSVEQILEMKKMALPEDRIRAACQ